MHGTIHLERISHSTHQLSIAFALDDLRFEIAYWYGDVDLHALRRRYGALCLDNIFFHHALFEITKLVSLGATRIDFGDYARFYTEPLDRLWTAIVHKVWAQWRYENDLPEHAAPAVASAPVAPPVDAVESDLGDTEVLSFCGGGKDSLVAMRLLEEAAIPYASFAYSNSVYGTAAPQHALIESLLRHGRPVRQHKQWVYDSLVDCPVLELRDGASDAHLLAAETPCSIFGALPVVLHHGYRHLALGHERSANVGNLVWDATGEDVNHQWGKSFEAECLLNDYIRSQLISNFSYFSVLQSVYDVVIFNFLRRDLDGVADTHSCNLRKPWCCECPKCAYVGLNYMAYLPLELAGSIFGRNLLDVPQNQRWYHDMLGLGEHTPFECIGQVPESRLAFEICKHKGVRGQAMDLYTEHFPTLDTDAILERYLRVEPEPSNLPEVYAERLLDPLRAAARDAREYIARQLQGGLSRPGDSPSTRP